MARRGLYRWRGSRGAPDDLQRFGTRSGFVWVTLEHILWPAFWLRVLEKTVPHSILEISKTACGTVLLIGWAQASVTSIMGLGRAVSSTEEGWVRRK
jgi:hypothetical protein